jgi:ribosome-associated protein
MNDPGGGAEYITLSAFLKLAGAASGGKAKVLIQGGMVSVDGSVCLQRGRKLFGGERVSLGGEEYEVELKNASNIP